MQVLVSVKRVIDLNVETLVKPDQTYRPRIADDKMAIPRLREALK